MRMSRRAGLFGGIKPQPLFDLFSAATIIASGGREGSSVQQASVTVQGGTATPVWVFCSTGYGVVFAKVKNNTVTYLKAVTGPGNNTSSTSIAARSSGSNTVITSGYSFGVGIIIFRFPGVEESEVDALLSNMTMVILAGRNNSATDLLSCPVSSIIAAPPRAHLYIQTFASSFSALFSMSSGDDPTSSIISTGVDAVYWRQVSNTFRIANSNGYDMYIRGGNICHLTM